MARALQCSIWNTTIGGMRATPSAAREALPACQARYSHPLLLTNRVCVQVHLVYGGVERQRVPKRLQGLQVGRGVAQLHTRQQQHLRGAAGDHQKQHPG